MEGDLAWGRVILFWLVVGSIGYGIFWGIMKVIGMIKYMMY